jgi:hypothetical protein
LLIQASKEGRILTMLLTKSDFKVARTCGTKLYYRKLGYPTTIDDDPYVEFLADGGYMVEAIAKLLFPGGREIVGDSVEERFAATSEALDQEDVTLFEATLVHNQLMAQVDILEKCGNQFLLIEVKAKTVEPREDIPSPFTGKRGGVFSEWIPYLEDVAYQTHILTSLYPDAHVIPSLCVVDKSQTSSSETAFENFHIKPRPKDRDGSLRKPEITFTGNVETLRNQSFVRIFEVTLEVEKLLPTVRNEAATFAATLTSDKPIRIEPTLGAVCKKCEYRMDQSDQSGFKDCWGDLADPAPHLLDLYQVGRLGQEVIADMIARRKTGLADVSPNDFTGKIGERQAMQLDWTLKNQEFIDASLPEILAKRRYPLHFLDFEATRLAVPYHAGMHPYGLVAFQWSCHTVREQGAELEHHEWINIDDAYPNFTFASKLKEVITGEGTVFVWSSFERSVLKDIRERMSWYSGNDPTLSDWLDTIRGEKGPIVDLYDLAKKFYFHPDMGGSVSIKKVLPAIWFHDAPLRGHRWFAEYLEEKDGQVLGPYETLKPLPFRDDGLEEEAVREGTAAIRTYEDMMYGAHRSDPEFRQTMKQRLLNYCRLDTAAMVMIWMHWNSRS